MPAKDASATRSTRSSTTDTRGYANSTRDLPPPSVSRDFYKTDINPQQEARHVVAVVRVMMMMMMVFLTMMESLVQALVLDGEEDVLVFFHA